MGKPFAKVIVFVAFLYGGPSFSQSTNASLSGNVVDASGGALPFVMIKLEDIQTGVVLTGTSNEAGIYQFPSVQPGLYRLEAEFRGFQKLVYTLLTFEVGAQVRLNLTLKVAGAAENLQVITLDSPLKANTASVGSVIQSISIRDLPLNSRSVLELTQTLAGTSLNNISGTRIGALNVTRDGINVMDQFLNMGVNSVVYTSTDLISEFRVITSPVDAEFGRGSAQVQIDTRSGTNEFHGSLFEAHNSTALNANTWFGNKNGNPRNVLIWNQFGGRLGGPIIKRKTFFHFLYDAERRVETARTTPITYTATARQGDFRFFPRVANANALATVPTVDLNGNPVKPAAATEDLQTISVFRLDRTRPVMDPTGNVQKVLAMLPLPNDFRFGDGLNTAGYAWDRKITTPRDQYNLRLDHQFNERHRFNMSWTRETGVGSNGYFVQTFPQSPVGKDSKSPSFFSLDMTSTLSPRLLNQFHAGGQRARYRRFAPWEKDGKASLPKANGIGYTIGLASVSTPVVSASGPNGWSAPLYVLGDKLAWQTGRHAFKIGGEARFANSNTFEEFSAVTPIAAIGSNPAAPLLLDLSAVEFAAISPGLGTATSLLLNLSGSVSSVQETLHASAGANPVFLPQGKQRDWKQREFSLFFKDDWSLRSNLVLNAGLRYEYYSVPWEANGKAAAPVGGSKGLFGVSGTSFADLYQPGRMTAPLTRIELIGKNSANPRRQLYSDDWNNFGPAVGLSWSMPYFGKDKTVVRVGYSIGYERNPLVLTDYVAGAQPGLRNFVVTTQYPDLTKIQLPLTPSVKPLETVPLDDRTQTVWAYDSNLRTPYVQNWNFTVERELPGRMSLAVRYVGNKGTKLIRGTNINEANVVENGILDAFLVTRAGGDAPLFDRMFNGLTLTGLGTVNGTTVTGSQFARFHSVMRSYLASNSVGFFANYLNTTTEFTNARGGLLRRAGLPENLIAGNPQFASAIFHGNFANSTYHAMEVELNKRFSSGWNLQSNYTWSKNLGEYEGAGETMTSSYRDGRNRRLDKRRLGFDFEHVFRNSGTFELPFGPNKRFGNKSSGVVSRLIEMWELGGIVNFFSGGPLGFTSGAASVNGLVSNTPELVGTLPKGRVKRVPTGVVYFSGLTPVPDPGIAAMTSSQNLQTFSTLKAIADAGGSIVLRNPEPGKQGMSRTGFEGPGWYRVDVDLIKRIHLSEGKEFEFRTVGINLMNSPVFGPPGPNPDINSSTFGNIVAATGSRRVELHARINF